MDVTKTSLHHINPHNFPAKLWRLVNNPTITSIFWDNQGEALIVDSYAFEKDILSPGGIKLPDIDLFRTTNYTSFVRQLNLYGFRKLQPAEKENPTFDHFANPNFKKNCPELVSTLRRLTAQNKAKMLAGVNLNNLPVRHERRYKRATTGEDADRGKSFSVHFENDHIIIFIFAFSVEMAPVCGARCLSASHYFCVGFEVFLCICCRDVTTFLTSNKLHSTPKLVMIFGTV